MSDLIDRQAAVAYAISGLTREFEGENWIRVSEIRESLKTMPPVQPEQRWIPVTEKLPERYGAYLVTMEDMVDEWGEADEDDKVQVRWYHKGYGFEDGDGYAVLAWMPLPKPWKGEDDEAD